MKGIRRLWLLPVLACAASLGGWGVISLRTRNPLGNDSPIPGEGPQKSLLRKNDPVLEGNEPTEGSTNSTQVTLHEGTDSSSEFSEGTVEVDLPAPKDNAALRLAIHEARHASLKDDRVQAVKTLRSYLFDREDDGHLAEVIHALAQAAEFDPETWVRKEAIQTLSFQVSEEAFTAFLRVGPLDPDEPVRWAWVRRLDTLANSENYFEFLRATRSRNRPLTREALIEIRRVRVTQAIEKLERLILVEPDAEIRDKAGIVLKTLELKR